MATSNSPISPKKDEPSNSPISLKKIEISNSPTFLQAFQNNEQHAALLQNVYRTRAAVLHAKITQPVDEELDYFHPDLLVPHIIRTMKLLKPGSEKITVKEVLIHRDEYSRQIGEELKRERLIYIEFNNKVDFQPQLRMQWGQEPKAVTLKINCLALSASKNNESKLKAFKDLVGEEFDVFEKKDMKSKNEWIQDPLFCPEKLPPFNITARREPFEIIGMEVEGQGESSLNLVLENQLIKLNMVEKELERFEPPLAELRKKNDEVAEEMEIKSQDWEVKKEKIEAGLDEFEPVVSGIESKCYVLTAQVHKTVRMKSVEKFEI